MADSVWAAIKTDWHEEARCKNVTESTFFPVVETALGLATVQNLFCNLCPVRGKCLNSALINNDEGYWGGTNTAMRRALARTRSRAKCPLCQGRNLVEVEPYEVCVRCGASWQAEYRPADRHPGEPEAV